MRSHMNSRRSRGPKPNRRRALELLAGSRDGMTEAMLPAHGFMVDILVDLIRAGLATAKTERMVVGGRPRLPACEQRRRPTVARGVPSSPHSHDLTDSQTRVGFSPIRPMGRGRRAR
jgi:hypothetical protein